MTSVTALPEDLKKIGNNIFILEQDLRLVENELNKPRLKNTQDMERRRYRQTERER